MYHFESDESFLFFCDSVESSPLVVKFRSYFVGIEVLVVGDYVSYHLFLGFAEDFQGA